MNAINGDGPTGKTPRPPFLREFVQEVYLPFCPAKLIESARSTTENRIQHHILRELGGKRIGSLTPSSLQR